jgi:CBS domain containing-hemolysin-like protein
MADGGVALHDLEAFLNARPPGEDASGSGQEEVRFPEQGDYETLGGFVTAVEGRVPPVGSLVAWDGLTFTVRAGDERRVSKVEIARRAEAPPGEAPPGEARRAGGA